MVAHQCSLGSVASVVLERLDGYLLWLLAAHTAWQPDSRISRHRKLWGSLKARGLPVPDGRCMEEGLVETAQGLRFFGALQLGLGSLGSVAAIIEAEHASHIVAVRSCDESIVSGMLKDGWDLPEFGPSIPVLEAVCEADGVLLWPVGAFDDREVGYAAFAKPGVIDRMLF